MTRAAVLNISAPGDRTMINDAVAEPPTMMGTPNVGPSGRDWGTSIWKCTLRREISSDTPWSMTSSAMERPAGRSIPIR